MRLLTTLLACCLCSANLQAAPLNDVFLDQVKTYVEVFELIENNQLSAPSAKTLFDLSVQGMLSIDEQGKLLSPAQYQDLKLVTEGTLAGPGFEIELIDNQWLVTKAKPGLAVQNKDVVLSINGQTLEPLASMKRRVFGASGSQVELELERNSKLLSPLVLVRKYPHNSQVQLTRFGQTLVAHVPVFNELTSKQLTEALQAHTPTTLVLDLRGTPGGLLESALDTVSLFLSDTAAVQIQSKAGVETVLTHPEAPFETLNLEVLIDNYTASAAEVVASALKPKASVYGAQSFGKGSVQQLWPLTNGNALKLTVAHYLSAQGTPIDSVGVTPDYPLTEWPLHAQYP